MSINSKHLILVLIMCFMTSYHHCSVSPIFITYHLLICFFYYYYSIASICPPKKSVISTLVLRALFTGTCVSLINACVAGKQSVIIKI